MAADKRATRRTPRNITAEELLDYVRQQPDRAASFRQILEDFQADRTDRKQIKDLLGQLVKNDKLIRHKGNRYEATPGLVLIEGRMSLHRDGFGFVIPDTPPPKVAGDIFIAPPLTGSSMHGDRVGVVITLRKPDGRAEGKVVRVVARAHDTVVGQLRFDSETFFVVPTDEKLPRRILVTNAESEHKDKIVEVELTRFPSEAHWPAGKIVSVIGFIDDPEVETTIIIRKYGLPLEFPDAVLEETDSLPDGVAEVDLEGRDDFRDRTVVTIDPDTARDYDDAIDVEELDDGSFRLGVHIADVSHFVEPDTAIDREARLRGTSVYFPDRVVPMLPEKISNRLCSLNPRVDRLATSVVMEVDSHGEIRSHSFHESVIRSSERMNYDQVQQILDGAGSVRSRYRDVVTPLKTMEKLAKRLMEQRRKRGTIDFDLPEPQLTFDSEGIVSGIVKAERRFSNRIIEEFMIAANEVVARALGQQRVATIYRVHDAPDPRKAEEFSELVAQLGLRFRPRSLRPLEFQKFVDSIAGRADSRMISYLMLRSFKQAAYSASNSGHFGLASEAYTHFTSPIRRYPDLIVHRILKSHIQGRRRAGYSRAQLGPMAAESSERERRADEAERELYDWKRMALLEERVGETFEALIISVWRDGMRIELLEQFIEGSIPVDEMSDDYYAFEPANRALVGRGTRRRFKLGQKIYVRLARVDKLLRRAYFLPVLANE